MTRLNDDQYWVDHPIRAGMKSIGYVWLTIIVVIVLGLITTGALWAGGVLFSPVKGRADAFKQQQSAPNRIFAQQHFETLYGDIRTADAQLTTASQNEKQFPGDPTYVTNFTGLQQLCLGDVNQYDQDSHKYLLKDFKTADLPAQINPADPATDCQP